MVIAIFLCCASGLMFYSYHGPITLTLLGSDKLLPLLLLIVGLVGVVSVLLGGSLTDTVGTRRARLAILGGHALALITTLSTLGTPTWLFASRLRGLFVEELSVNSLGLLTRLWVREMNRMLSETDLPCGRSPRLSAGALRLMRPSSSADSLV